ncbi:MAG: amidase [Ignavibacteriaceae bacterium]|nr:MAG: amidase [Ignavibacteriaceae bacterium]
MDEPLISVGILTDTVINFTCYGDYYTNNQEDFFSGIFQASVKHGKLVVEGSGKKLVDENSLVFTPNSPETEHFMIKDVVIGVQFHWERKEKENFKGSLKLLRKGDKVTAINIINIEEYLKSVISSEMSAKSSMALLKAHAVISRSWLLSQIEQSKSKGNLTAAEKGMIVSDEEVLRWYDREDHEDFDVCADDHCQRYQGITKIFTDSARKAVEETSGLVMKFGQEICDARFSKACGGISEAFENVWEGKKVPYLSRVIDYKFEPEDFDTDLTKEQNSVKWISGNPEAYCNTDDKAILSQVLLHYDQETIDFYRWQTELTQAKIQELLKNKMGIDLGVVLRMIPLHRGESGRIYSLKIEGSRKSITIGKELEIRRALSDSHLYSSAFIVETLDVVDGVPGKFLLRGAGWGHGVGLCQIGAAVMAEKGFSFDEILLHYYRGIDLVKIY